MTTDKPNCTIRCSLLSWRRTVLKGLLESTRHGVRVTEDSEGTTSEDQNSTFKKEKKPEEVGSEVFHLCCVVTETFGVLSLFGVTHCYSYRKIGSVVINCS
jgi:hypothetical protein